MSDDTVALWDEEAATFDQAPDHGLSDPGVRDAWRRLLLRFLPTEQPLAIADLGCGTGTLAVLLSEAGHHVQGVDFAPRMLQVARRKAAAVDPAPTFTEGDAADPPLRRHSFDVVLSRHVLWAMSDPAMALRRWQRLLRSGGRLLLVEGSWSTGAGLTATDCVGLLRQLGGALELYPLDDPLLWGGPITDERYLISCSPASDHR